MACLVRPPRVAKPAAVLKNRRPVHPQGQGRGAPVDENGHDPERKNQLDVQSRNSPGDSATVVRRRRTITLGKWSILALLVLATIVNLMDRQLPFIMAEPIKAEFDLSDTELGMLGGIGFSLVYALAALPLARLADRRSRRLVLAGSIAVWSLCTAAGGLATNYFQLLASRAGVAFGEAGAAPATHSLVADLFPPRQRAFALGLTSAGISLGVLVGMAVGGYALQWMDWRTALMLAAIPGALLSLIFVAFVQEPPRHGARDSTPPALRTACARLWGQRSFFWMVAGCMLCTFSSAGSAAFGASFFMRVHGSTLATAGLIIGVAVGLAGALGGILSGYLADRLSLRDRRWVLWLAAISMLLRTPLYIAAWFATDVATATILLVTSGVLTGGYLPMTYTATQAIADARMRAFASAVTQLAVNLLGGVVGPIVVGIMSDALEPRLGVLSIAYALAIAGAAALVAVACYWRASKFYLSDIADHDLRNDKE